MAVTFAHIVNPFATENNALQRIHQVTFRSLEQAVAFSAHGAIELLSAQYATDRDAVPNGFRPTPDLDRSVLDLHVFIHKKRLPLLADVLSRAYEASDAEYIIYTNMDIIVQPYFYEALEQMLADGADALIINRRRIADSGQTWHDLPMVLSEVGYSHPGFDCFVMHRSLIAQLQLDGLCLGVPFVEAGLMYNLVAFAKDCRIMEHLHLTTHLGLDVMPRRDAQYHGYNRNCFKAIVRRLKPHLVGKRMPYSELSLLTRIWKRALNPAVFSGLHLELEGRGMVQRLYGYWNALRFRMLSR